MPDFSYKGTKLHPLTENEARSLDARDIIKYIGSDNNEVYRYLMRTPRRLRDKPKISYKGDVTYIEISSGYAWDDHCFKNPITDWALCERGNKYELLLNRAKKYIPVHFRKAKEDIEAARQSRVNAIDSYLNELPLHLKLEVLKNLSKADQELYDHISRPIEVPKEVE